MQPVDTDSNLEKREGKSFVVSPTNRKKIDFLLDLEDGFFDINKENKKNYDGNVLKEELMIPPSDLCSILGTTLANVHNILKSNGIKATKIGSRTFIPSAEVRRLLQIYGHRYAEEIISFICTKGGVGKSTSSHTLAIRFNQLGARVLVIDTDQQANTTTAFGINEGQLYCLIDIIKGDIDINDSIVHITPNLDLIPSNIDNSALEKYIHSNPGRLDLLIMEMVKKIKTNYDYIIFDCSPALGLLNSSILMACTRVVLPVNPNEFSLNGAAKTLLWIKDITTHFRSRTSTEINIFLNRHNASKKSSDEYLKRLNTHELFKNFILDSFIRENEHLSRRINDSQSIFTEHKSSPAREDFDLLAREIMGLKYPPSSMEKSQ
ncbi:MAG: AAA family ATPase [Oligoflexia bacterium]|nr:AAA family ATPase [Oligoflexia bacterium]